MSWTHKSSSSSRRVYQGQHRSEHWYRDNQVYFITARCRDRYPALADEEAKAVFWDRFDFYTEKHGFVPWVTSVLDNHYHSIGYLRVGLELKEMMRKLHGSVAKLANDVLSFEARALQCPCRPPRNESGRLLPFWSDKRDKDYFDGCLRNERQGVLTYRYVLTQSVRHGIVRDYRDYPHTRVNVAMERAIRRATELGAWLYGVRYRRYEGGPGHGH